MNYAALDAETDPFKMGRLEIKPFIWGYYDGDEYNEFRNDYKNGKETDNCTAKLFEFLDSITEPTIIYAHNGGKFDFHFFIDRIPFGCELTVIAGRITKFKYNDLIEFRDSYALLPTALSAFQKDEFNYDLMEKGIRFNQKVIKEISHYLRNDCIFLYEYLGHFFAEFGVSLTIAGAAMKQWQEIADTKLESDEMFYKMFAPHYYGGRVECFKGGIINDKLAVYDINSAYPYAMTFHHAASAEYESVRYKTVRALYDAIQGDKRGAGAYFVEVECVAHGCFPYRDGLKLSFPRDKESRHYFVTGWEFVAAVETGAIKQAKNIRCKIVKRTICFTDYVTRFYAMKSEAKKKWKETGSAREKARYGFAKLFLNSLYGKTAANPDHYKHYYMSDLAEAETLSLPDNSTEKFAAGLTGKHVGAINGDIVISQSELEFNEKHYYNVACGASITGFVRAYLYRHIHKAKGVVYCDTDSIFCSDPADMKIGDALGEWENEGEYLHGGVGGKKLYAFANAEGKWKTASKGARLTPDEIMTVAAGGEVLYTPLAPTFGLSGARLISRRIKATL